jgi:hypothetical protein
VEKVEQTGESANVADEGRFAIVYGGLQWFAVVGWSYGMLVLQGGGGATMVKSGGRKFQDGGERTRREAVYGACAI